MKQVLYIFLYAPYIEWKLLTEWFDKLLKRKNNVGQFLLYYQKVWLHNKDLWHVDDLFHVSLLTNCAIESYHRRLNASVKSSASLEEFNKSIYSFDMKNYRELSKHNHELRKYEKFLEKKDDIVKLMNKILDESPPLVEKQDVDHQSLQTINHHAEEWCTYDERHNDLINEILFGDNLDNNPKIIEHNIDNIINQFRQD